MRRVCFAPSIAKACCFAVCVAAAQVELFLSKGTPVSSMVDQLHQGSTALHNAARSGFVAGVKLLVAAGANTGLQEHHRGATPLILSVERRDMEMVKVRCITHRGSPCREIGMCCGGQYRDANGALTSQPVNSCPWF